MRGWAWKRLCTRGMGWGVRIVILLAMIGKWQRSEEGRCEIPPGLLSVVITCSAIELDDEKCMVPVISLPPCLICSLPQFLLRLFLPSFLPSLSPSFPPSTCKAWRHFVIVLVHWDQLEVSKAVAAMEKEDTLVGMGKRWGERESSWGVCLSSSCRSS